MPKVTIIRPQERLFQVDFRELVRYRDLWKILVRRNIITKYKQTVLGPLWFLINPILSTVIYMVVFGGIARISTDGLPQPLFYLAGICLWNYFAECLNTSSGVFISNEHIFGKVYFPRLIMPLSSVTSALFTLGIQLLLFIGFYVYYFATGAVGAPNLHLLLFPFLILILACLGLGFGIIVSSLTTKYRDLSILFSFVVQLWMYATPVIYPLSMLSEKRQWIAVMNPVTSIVETFKYGVTGIGTFSWGNLMYSTGFAVVLMFVGILVFNRVQRSFMDNV